MKKVKLFLNARSQAVRLPKGFRFEGKNVLIQKYGDTIILVPNDKKWEVFVDGLNSFTNDFLENV